MSASKGEFKYHRRIAKRLGFTPFNHAEVWPQEYSYGMEYAVTMLMKSLEPGIHEPTVKFGTVRKVRAMATNVEEQLNVPGEIGRMYKHGRQMKLESPLPSSSQWLKRFMKGLRGRMGERLRQD